MALKTVYSHLCMLSCDVRIPDHISVISEKEIQQMFIVTSMLCPHYDAKLTTVTLPNPGQKTNRGAFECTINLRCCLRSRHAYPLYKDNTNICIKSGGQDLKISIASRKQCVLSELFPRISLVVYILYFCKSANGSLFMNTF